MQHAIVCSYSRSIAGWLTNKFPGSVSLDSSSASNEEIISIFQLLLPAIEFQATTQGDFNLSERIKHLSGLSTKKKQLRWLIDLFAQSDLHEPVKDELYGQLKVFVKWQLDSAQIEWTYLHLPFAKQEDEGSFIKSIQVSRIARKKLNAPVLLSAEEKSFLLDSMKISLALNYRETDPITFADQEELELFDMGRGLSIALVGMQKQKRLSLESYIGYMAFKNGVPIAYGGGWIWGQRCRIGISIYPDFRKGESAWLFGQVLRLYYQHFNARHFIIRANQFGKGNYDGLRSGAFWFYYKLGFRPADYDLKRLARNEWKKIWVDKTYRSSLKTLRFFTAGPLELKLDKSSFPQVDAETISRRISDIINTDYGCSRIKALRSERIQIGEKLKPPGLPKQFKLYIRNSENWNLLINLLSDFQDWGRNDKKRMVDLIQLKETGKERDHIIGMQQFPVFWKFLDKL